jgi:hypothetical protein
MHFEPFPVLPGRSAIDVHDSDGRKAATIYAIATRLHIVFERGYGADPRGTAIEVKEPTGLFIGIARQDR